MVKINAAYNTDGYITRYSTATIANGTVEDIDEAQLSNIIIGVTKIVDGALLYRCAVDTDADGYVIGVGTDPAGTLDLYADELVKLVPRATKLTDGHLVVDADKLAEIQADSAKPVPTAQDTINAQLLKATAQSQLANAMLLKQMATVQEMVNNG